MSFISRTAVATLTADGDYGDIVVSASGTAWSFDSGVVTAFARTILDDANAGAVRSTLGLGTAAVKNTGTSGDAVALLNGANTHSGFSDFSAGFRATGTTTPGTGVGIEIVWTGGEGRLNSFDRDTAAWQPLLARGSTVEMVCDGATALNVTPSVVTSTPPLRLPQSTVAGLPAAGSVGRTAFVTDANATTFASVVAGGGANGVPVYDDGTNWRIG